MFGTSAHGIDFQAPAGLRYTVGTRSWSDAGRVAGHYALIMHPTPPPLFGRLRAGQWIVIDGLAAAALIAGSALLDQRAGIAGASPAGLLVAVLATIAAALRRRWSPQVLAGVVLTVAVAAAITGFPALWLAIAYTTYYVPLRLTVRAALWLLGATVMLAVLGMVNAMRMPLPGAEVFTDPVELLVRSVLPIAVGWTIGYAIRQQRMYAAQMREQADREAQDRLTAARRAMSEERLLIARELHDVVAHTLGVIAVQAGVANHIAGQRPNEAQRVLVSIEQTSREALREMRALLGVLRTDGDRLKPPTGPPAPVPGLADLTTLVERSAEAGLRVDLETTSEYPEVPAGVQLAVYRVVQEALTNVIKHAATDHAKVRVTYQSDTIIVEVTDRGAGIDTLVPGHGIVGMRERAGMYGGQLQVGPRVDGGFHVRGVFPLNSGTAA
jgi:signal transduction histidine kinase